MDANFQDNELLYRSIKPDVTFWKESGILSSAAFKDSKGLSVDRAAGRCKPLCVEFLLSRFPQSCVASVKVEMCKEVDALVKYAPIDCESEKNEYHSEIHKSESVCKLTDGQAKKLARLATIEYGN